MRYPMLAALSVAGLMLVGCDPGGDPTEGGEGVEPPTADPIEDLGEAGEVDPGIGQTPDPEPEPAPEPLDEEDLGEAGQVSEGGE